MKMSKNTILKGLYAAMALSFSVLAAGNAQAADMPSAPQAADASMDAMMLEAFGQQEETPVATGVAAFDEVTASGAYDNTAEPIPASSTSSPLASAPKAEKPKPMHLFQGIESMSYAGRIVKDTAGKKGDSDDNGDYKGADAAIRLARSNNTALVLGITAELYSTQKIEGRQYDTAELSATAGFETKKWGAYAKLGQVNGVARDFMYSIVDMAHKASGMGTSRKSPPSSPPRMIMQLGGRRDFSVVESKRVDVQVVPYINLGNTLRSAGVTAAAALKITEGKTRPDVPGQPIQERTGVQLYGALNAQAVQYDLRTARLDTRPVQMSATAGISAGFKFATVQLGTSRMLTPELKNDVRAPVGRNEYRLTVKFKF